MKMFIVNFLKQKYWTCALSVYGDACVGWIQHKTTNHVSGALEVAEEFTNWTSLEHETFELYRAL